MTTQCKLRGQAPSSTSHDGAFLSSRDGVLGELQAAAGYKLSTSGTVQGVAQCLGDVPAADCTAADTSMTYRKCSSCTSHGDAFLSSRDGVLGELQAVTGYKLSTSGTVHGWREFDLRDDDPLTYSIDRADARARGDHCLLCRALA
uniref:Uncharacterized protein n=1 Tax=Oryza brachyantha TaxID=4533 RepID=J3NCV1_ORYBR